MGAFVTGVISFKINPNHEERTIKKIIEHICEPSEYLIRKFVLAKQKATMWTVRVTAPEHVVLNHLDYISTLNTSVLPEDPKGKIEILGFMLTRDEEEE